MFYFSILIGKITILLMRLLGKNANSLPGLVIEKINPDFLKKALDRLPKGVVVVTGTNGKTTTTKIIKELLEQNNLRVISNQTGGNFVRGIVSVLLDKFNFSAKLNYDIAVFELDEAHGVQFTKLYSPRGVVVLNVLRDQLDRFGEIDNTANLISKIVSKARDFVVLNANDSRVSKLASNTKAEVSFFAYSEKLKNVFISDDQHYSKIIEYFISNNPDLSLESINSDQITIKEADSILQIPFRLSGPYNALNIVASLLAVKHLGIKNNDKELVNFFNKLKPAFGRGEIIELNNGASLQLQLVKNPSGFNQALTIVKEDNFKKIGIAINDNYADGRDVSWLFDVDFSCLDNMNVYTSGVRYLDMAVRLKYQGIVSDNVSELNSFVDQIIKLDRNDKAIIYCTYTAMLNIRKILNSKNIKIVEAGL